MTPPCERCSKPGRARPDPDGDTRPRVLCRRCARLFERYADRCFAREIRKRDRVLWTADAPELDGPARAVIAASFDPAQRALPTLANRWTPAQLALDLGRRQARYLIARAGRTADY